MLQRSRGDEVRATEKGGTHTGKYQAGRMHEERTVLKTRNSVERILERGGKYRATAEIKSEGNV